MELRANYIVGVLSQLKLQIVLVVPHQTVEGQQSGETGSA